ncbi:MAG TPA: hypothetical protein VFX25_18185 [Streptosporangiaceae bacterium]|nr:hypothetical protein [Streptosporangiaceae bacterium]
MRFFVTDDSGRTWTTGTFPNDAAIQSAACPTASQRLAAGVYSTVDPKAGPDLPWRAADIR